MKLLKIPMPDRSQITREFALRVTLDGRSYELGFSWSTRARHWFLDLFDSEGSAIQVGRKCVVDWPLLRCVTDARRPTGELAFFDVDRTGRDPGLYDLGYRTPLFYLTNAE